MRVHQQVARAAMTSAPAALLLPSRSLARSSPAHCTCTRPSPGTNTWTRCGGVYSPELRVNTGSCRF